MKANTDGLTMNQLAERNAEHVTTIAALESRCAALASENAGLMAAKEIIRHLNVNREEANFFGIDDCYIDDAVAAMITPVTDAFLAEVRASAIDSLVGIKTKQLANMHPDTHAFGATAMSIRSQINELQSFAAQLRKGGAA
ncbi:hypothetical protein CHT23_003821 [Salmonella enterica subsp. houtenae serovar 48:z4,z32:-]|nr:hypothetical protein [Salmonella enterica subsp. enterica serovar Bonariensis]EEE1767024.1 hypothetical protein [Salmonella enterica subsp. houtenae serovar 48:z4,z32:-]EIC5148336.1 hypothetical protein [Salmonella enterica]EIK7839331.1 hypothetical protein [Salmonella enterica]EJK3096066.1 hypothetical protein [Salmonella enterica]